jgi:hypothetical protein
MEFTYRRPPPWLSGSYHPCRFNTAIVAFGQVGTGKSCTLFGGARGHQVSHGW